MTGNPVFESLVRVHLNTLERLALFLPLFAIASQHWPHAGVVVLGASYLVGRVVYWKGCVKQPDARKGGNILTVVSIELLLLASLVGLGRGAFAFYSKS